MIEIVVEFLYVHVTIMTRESLVRKKIYHPNLLTKNRLFVHTAEGRVSIGKTFICHGPRISVIVHSRESSFNRNNLIKMFVLEDLYVSFPIFMKNLFG